MKSLIILAALLFAFMAGAGLCADNAARADLVNEKGEKVGTAGFVQGPQGVVVTVTAAGLPPGVHALHLHQTGKCEPPFATAGGHFNPLVKKHGLLNAEGSHAGDLPNVHVGADGRLDVELLAPGVALAGGANALLDDDGAALVLHQNADDYTTDPAGNAGLRILCGVIVR